MSNTMNPPTSDVSKLRVGVVGREVVAKAAAGKEVKVSHEIALKLLEAGLVWSLEEGTYVTAACLSDLGRALAAEEEPREPRPQRRDAEPRDEEDELGMGVSVMIELVCDDTSDECDPRARARRRVRGLYVHARRALELGRRYRADGGPDDPRLRAVIQEIRRVQREIQALRADPGGAS